MSETIRLAAERNKILFFFERVRVLYLKHPHWWVWLCSLFVWVLLVQNLIATSNEVRYTGPIIYCTSAGAVQVTVHPGYEIENILRGESTFYRILTVVSNGLLPWIIMVLAMMLPLLKEPIRHVAFSVKRKNKDLSIVAFLVGYTVTWSVFGVLFILLPFFMDIVLGNPTPFLNSLIKASGFLLAALFIWHPARPVRMMKCGQTMPIRIQGVQMYLDCLLYGLKMGFICLTMCWAPMAALMLSHHNVILMFVVTVVAIYERYLLPHTSKLSGYVWAFVAISLFCIEVFN